MKKIHTIDDIRKMEYEVFEKQIYAVLKNTPNFRVLRYRVYRDYGKPYETLEPSQAYHTFFNSCLYIDKNKVSIDVIIMDGDEQKDLTIYEFTRDQKEDNILKENKDFGLSLQSEVTQLTVYKKNLVLYDIFEPGMTPKKAIADNKEFIEQGDDYLVNKIMPYEYFAKKYKLTQKRANDIIWQIKYTSNEREINV